MKKHNKISGKQLTQQKLSAHNLLDQQQLNAIKGGGDVIITDIAMI